MSFLRRLFGGDAPSTGAPEVPTDPVDLDAAERAHELDLMREEQDRLDELAQRQLRYADHAWQPPAQGGDRRSDDREASQGD
ncbi:MAG TPA: hypothetical protein VD763_06705 [Candidatus Saccharimonadales bacterium]|nr:hypothetical protein [Candidatus Saccharimonadales bacterium]